MMADNPVLVQVGWMRKHGKSSVLLLGRHDDVYEQDEDLEPVYKLQGGEKVRYPNE